MMGRIETLQFDAAYYPAAVFSFAFFLALFKYVSPQLSARLVPTFSQLSDVKQIDWHSRVNSSVHATVVSCMCVYAMWYEENMNKDPIWWDCPTVRTSCAIVVGYMAADVIVMATYYKQIGDMFYFFHHGASIYAYFYVMTYGVVPYFANYRLIAEFSTPLVNHRWFLDVLNYNRSDPRYIGTGVAMTVIFFAVRILTMPQYWYTVYQVYGTDSFIRLGHIQLVLVVTCFLLDILNLIWFYKMCKGVHKVVSAKLDNNRNFTDKLD